MCVSILAIAKGRCVLKIYELLKLPPHNECGIIHLDESINMIMKT